MKFKINLGKKGNKLVFWKKLILFFHPDFRDNYIPSMNSINLRDASKVHNNYVMTLNEYRQSNI